MTALPIQLGPIGIWTSHFEQQPAAKAQEAAAQLEELGFGAIWFPEGMGREALTNAGLLLAGTRRIVVATGIANIYARGVCKGTRVQGDVCARGRRHLNQLIVARFGLRTRADRHVAEMTD